MKILIDIGDWKKYINEIDVITKITMNQSDIKNYWDNKFELFEEHSSGYIDPYIQKIDDKIRWGTFIREVNLNPNEKILDAGCNFGLWSIRLAKLGLEVIGIDLINEAIKKQKKRHQVNHLI